MKTKERGSIEKAWAKALARPGQEFPLTFLSVKQGNIPAGLRGTLYRNGPARFERGGSRVGHWFDGDGAILAVHFTQAGATGVYRYVQTEGYQAEEKADRFLFSNYGMTAPDPLWLRWLKPVKNAANTSVLALPDKLLALWEGGRPHALDLETLDTRGLEDLGGLKDGFSYSAHGKRDPVTGTIYNFGVRVGAGPKLNLYKSDRTGRIIQTSVFPLKGIPLIHDFVLAGQYLIFFLPPLRVQPFPLLFGLRSYSESFDWKPELGTQILVFDRETLSLVSQGETDPWFQWHFANGYVTEAGEAVADLIRFSDFQTNQRLREVTSGKTVTNAEGTLWRVCLNPQTGQVTAMEELCDRVGEFPTVSAAEVGLPSRYTYFATYRPGVEIVSERYGAIARFDNHTRQLTLADCGENCYPTEPIYAPDGLNPARGWIITVVYDGNADCSELWIYDSEGLDRDPVCKLELPSVIPLGFHGTWKEASS